MNVAQLYQLMNTIREEVIGESFILNEDLSNVTDFGKVMLDTVPVDNYVRTLVNHIGKVVFNDRKYSGVAPSIYKDAWEFGSILEKITFVMPDSIEDPAWNLQDGQSYDYTKFVKPEVKYKLFNGKTVFAKQLSITEKQVKESFSSPKQLSGFISGLFTSVENAIVVETDALIMRTINSMIDKTFEDGNELQKVNLLKMYNDQFDATLTPKDCFTNESFLKFATSVMGEYMDYLALMNTQFNIDGEARFTPVDKNHLVLLSTFKRKADVYLQSEVFHNEFTSLPKAETVPCWQGSKNITDPVDGAGRIEVNYHEYNGIIGVMFDDNAICVTNEERYTTAAPPNPLGEFTNYYFKINAGYIADTSENFVVFCVQETRNVDIINGTTKVNGVATNQVSLTKEEMVNHSMTITADCGRDNFDVWCIRNSDGVDVTHNSDVIIINEGTYMTNIVFKVFDSYTLTAIENE